MIIVRIKDEALRRDRGSTASGHYCRVYERPVSGRCSLSRLRVSGPVPGVGCRERAAFIGGWGLLVGAVGERQTVSVRLRRRRGLEVGGSENWARGSARRQLR